jgi:hypothetical protein
VNFYLYCICCKKFRDDLVSMFSWFRKQWIYTKYFSVGFHIIVADVRNLQDKIFTYSCWVKNWGFGINIFANRKTKEKNTPSN